MSSVITIRVKLQRWQNVMGMTSYHGIAPTSYPHPSELADWETRRSMPVPERHRYYHWGHINSQLLSIGA